MGEKGHAVRLDRLLFVCAKSIRGAGWIGTCAAPVAGKSKAILGCGLFRILLHLGFFFIPFCIRSDVLIQNSDRFFSRGFMAWIFIYILLYIYIYESGRYRNGVDFSCGSSAEIFFEIFLKYTTLITRST